ncbi:MAG: discoidin domain-containing protein [Colwellia sp.]
MKKTTLTLVMVSILSSTSHAANQCEWTEIWKDDFTNGLDSNVWSHEVNGDGGGNNELQFYTDRTENSWVENGVLNIKAIREEYQGKSWTSARLRTKNAKEWTYGKIEARVSLPTGSGTWPAFWLLPTEQQRDSHGWPQSGEIDILESGGDKEELEGTLHFGAYWPYNGNTGWVDGDTNLNDIHEEAGRTKADFQTYAIEWYEDKMVWLVNDQVKLEWTRDQLDGPDPVRSSWDSFTGRPFHIMLNLAMGGWYTGNPDGSEAAEQLMQVDYIAVYKNQNTWSIEGDSYVYRDEPLKNYHVEADPQANYQWTAPQGATIVSGQGTNNISVAYNANTISGDMNVSFDAGCGTQTYTKAIAVEKGITQLISDYENGLTVNHYQNGLQQGEVNPDTGYSPQFNIVNNPNVSALNNSAKVLHYVRDTGSQWDNLKLSGFGNINTGEIKSGRAKVFIDAFVPNNINLLGQEFSGGFENTLAVSAAEIWDGNTGRLSRYSSNLGQSGTWQTLELHYTGTADSAIASSQADSMVFMINAGKFTNAELYLDNPRIVWPGNYYTDQNILADFEGPLTASIFDEVQTSGNFAQVANPNPSEVNSSATVLKYDRDVGAAYDIIAFNQITQIPDALDAQHGMVRVVVDVLTDAPAGTIISMNMENQELAASVGPEAWQVGRHSFYQAETSTQGQWETIEFNYNFMAQQGDWDNNLVSAHFTAVDQLIFLITPGIASEGTYYFDNLRVTAFNDQAPIDGDVGCTTDCGCTSNCDVTDLVSQGKVVIASSELFAASSVVDGNIDTRWESAHGIDPTWLMIDLAEEKSLQQIVIHWEAANASDYEIQGSTDGTNWVTLSTFNNGTFGVRTDTLAIEGNYQYVRMYGNTRSEGNLWGYSIYEMEVYAGVSEDGGNNGGNEGTATLLNAVASASSELSPASAATDGNAATRWESAHATDPSYLTLDLGAIKTLSNIEIDWEVANAEEYQILASTDGINWTEINTQVGGTFGARTDSITLSGQYQYIRINGTKRREGNLWGYSIFEARVYGY